MTKAAVRDLTIEGWIDPDIIGELHRPWGRDPKIGRGCALVICRERGEPFVPQLLRSPEEIEIGSTQTLFLLRIVVSRGEGFSSEVSARFLGPQDLPDQISETWRRNRDGGEEFMGILFRGLQRRLLRGNSIPTEFVATMITLTAINLAPPTP